MTNDDKYQKYLLKKIYKYLIIFLSLVTIFLESLALFKTISYLWGLIPFILIYIVKYFYYKSFNTENTSKNTSKNKDKKRKRK